eukprot:TRINITY_DN17813_c0_g1_i1.p1 TRINITY_DN17813_c0_g1~~TRINITY_DN17813_c0_g1_i1.p1  ORF type:complete len:584 (-),score=84.49 TRINITY_DN17813_c0_g1_i1:72-1823(-)
MGNAPGGDVPQQISIKSVGKRLSRRGLVAKWQTRTLPEQVFGVVRHAERADGAYAFFRGGRWTQTADFQMWPLDPPLSDAGIEAASDIGHFVQEFITECSSRIHVVITSPFARCVQTAAEICLQLGPTTRLIIDRSLGEVFGPSVMGSAEPVLPVRPIGVAMDWVKHVGVQIHPRAIGAWPSWPEDLKAARRRYANRFLTYLQRGKTARRNFILVTHADGVGAALSMMPSQVGKNISSVEYGGMFLARRQGQKPSAGRHNAGSSFRAVLPGTPEGHGENDASEFACWAQRSDKAPSWSEAAPKSSNSLALFKEADKPRCIDDAPQPPKASDGWKVEVSNINLQPRPTGSKQSAPATFMKRLQSLAKDSKMSQKQMEGLLGQLSEVPLGRQDSMSPGTDGKEHGQMQAQEGEPLVVSKPLMNMQMSSLMQRRLEKGLDGNSPPKAPSLGTPPRSRSPGGSLVGEPVSLVGEQVTQEITLFPVSPRSSRRSTNSKGSGGPKVEFIPPPGSMLEQVASVVLQQPGIAGNNDGVVEVVSDCVRDKSTKSFKGLENSLLMKRRSRLEAAKAAPAPLPVPVEDPPTGGY